jgi:heat-inducible transcriptional repressor
MSETELSQRRQTVLRLVVREHISTAMPVSSKTISERYSLGVSPATIRNEMAILEEQGYLTHPHTSAGRVPTEKGYRYFVEKLMGESRLSPDERRTISHQFHQARLELDQWMRLSAAVLAHNVQGASLVTAPKSSQSRVKHLELISIRDEMVLLILVLQEGTVKQQILSADAPVSQDELTPIARYLTDLWSGSDQMDVAVSADSLVGFEQQVTEVVLETIRRLDSRTSSEVYRDGLLNVLNQPEFVQSENAQQVVRALEERQVIDRMVDDVMQRGGLQIIIGGEGRWEELSEVSVVLARYGIHNQATGALGVLGPMRMQYGRAVSVVRYVSQLMSDLISDLYGGR